jgi:predicted dehydrogenase
MRRRDVLTSAASSAGPTILKGGVLRGQHAPSDRLNVALIGVWGRGTAFYNVLGKENVVALCDVNDRRTKEALQVFPKAKTYWDWRRCLDQKDIDAVVICTADHHHAFIANWALNRDMHVYCEKPLGISVEEVRTVRANYRKRKAKVATQHGTQRHAYPNFERLRELILDGVIGELKVVHSWDSRRLPRPGYPAAEGQSPSFLNYEQWIGPSPYHPYSPQYFGGSNGLNCLFWNMYRDFGVGQMGDMGPHTMDLVWNAIDAGAPAAIEADRELSDAFDANIAPVKLKVSFEHPANSWRGPVTVIWYQGGLKPEAPKTFLDVSRIGNGVIFEGTKGVILADFHSRAIIPNNDDGDLTYYRRRTEEQLLPLVGGTGYVTQAPVRPPRAPAAVQPPTATAAPARTIDGRPIVNVISGGNISAAMPSVEPGPSGFPLIQFVEGGLPLALGLPNPAIPPILEAERKGQSAGGRLDVFQLDWIDACKRKSDNVVHGTSTKTHCDFDYAGTLMEQLLLGLAAHQAGRKLDYDAEAGRITNAPDANAYLKRNYRPNWTLNG